MVSTVDRFWNKVDKSDGCWEWTGSKNPNGYGTFSLHCVPYYAHRVSYAMANGGKIRRGMSVCHTCDNPGCVNPDHLWLGTGKENSRDMVKKGRCVKAKLTEEDVRWIRQLGGTNADLARCFGVGGNCISKIKSRKSWKHIT